MTNITTNEREWIIVHTPTPGWYVIDPENRLSTIHEVSRHTVRDDAIAEMRSLLGDPEWEPEEEDPERDPDAELERAIESASSLEDLKSAMLGRLREGRVSAQPPETS